MKRFQVTKDDDCLTLSMPLDYYNFFVGAALFVVAAISNLVLAALGIMTEQRYKGMDGGILGPMSFFDPPRNPFGFLWGVSFVLILIFIPLYAVKIGRSGLVYRFHRRLGIWFRNEHELVPLRRIECIRMRRLVDADGGHWYRLVIIYADGQEIFIDDSYDEEEVRELAYEIAEYSDAHVTQT